MTPVPIPQCFAYRTALYRLLETNGFDVSAAANALARWLCNGPVDTLYVQALNAEVGRCFILDLRNALMEIPEVVYVRDLSRVLTTRGKKLVELPPYVNPPTDSARHIVFRFMAQATLPIRFSREDFVSVLACGNTEDGPSRYQCVEQDNILCIRSSISRELPCGRCFAMGTKSRLRRVFFSARTSDCVDEGVVVEPMGISADAYLGRAAFVILSDSESD